MEGTEKEDLKSYLTKIGLSKYTKKIEADGYDLKTLKNINSEEFKDLCETVNLTGGNKSKLRQALGVSELKNLSNADLLLEVKERMTTAAFPISELESAGRKLRSTLRTECMERDDGCDVMEGLQIVSSDPREGECTAITSHIIAKERFSAGEIDAAVSKTFNNNIFDVRTSIMLAKVGSINDWDSLFGAGQFCILDDRKTIEYCIALKSDLKFHSFPKVLRMPSSKRLLKWWPPVEVFACHREWAHLQHKYTPVVEGEGGDGDGEDGEREDEADGEGEDGEGVYSEESEEEWKPK